MIETKLNGKNLILHNEFLNQGNELVKLSKKNKREELAFISGKKNDEIILEKMHSNNKISQKSSLNTIIIDPLEVYNFLSKIDVEASSTGSYAIGMSHTHDERIENLIENISLFDISVCHGFMPERINVLFFWDDLFMVYKQSHKMVNEVLKIYERNYEKSRKEMEQELHHYLRELEKIKEFDVKLLKLPD
jgi:hypothetical protein